jgi:D-tyrosyl-tRNA(Tyr) deacylase
MGEMDEDIHLAMHREADELGKFATQLKVHAPKAMSREEAAAFLRDLLTTITKGCMEHGADLVGHVKAFLKAESGAMSASLVDLDRGANVTHDFGQETTFQDAELTLHVIVHGIWDPEVREQSLEAIEGVVKRHGLSYQVVKDYYEKEKGMAHHGG